MSVGLNNDKDDMRQSAWLRRGDWRYRSLIDWLIDAVYKVKMHKTDNKRIVFLVQFI